MPARVSLVADDLAAGRLAVMLNRPLRTRHDYYAGSLPEKAARPAGAAFRAWLLREATGERATGVYIKASGRWNMARLQGLRARLLPLLGLLLIAGCYPLEFESDPKDPFDYAHLHPTRYLDAQYRDIVLRLIGNDRTGAALELELTRVGATCQRDDRELHCVLHRLRKGRYPPAFGIFEQPSVRYVLERIEVRAAPVRGKFSTLRVCRSSAWLGSDPKKADFDGAIKTCSPEK